MRHFYGNHQHVVLQCYYTYKFLLGKLTNRKGNVIPTRKLASQFNMPEKLIAAGLGPCLNISPPRNRGMGPKKEWKFKTPFTRCRVNSED